MSKIAFIADPHIGNHRRFGGVYQRGINERCKEAILVLERAVNLAVREGCDHLFILGDLFDNANPNPRIVAKVQEVLTSDCVVIILPGNHDSYSSEENDNCLGPLSPVATVVNGPTFSVFRNIEVLSLPYRVGRVDDWLPEEVSKVWGEGLRGIGIAKPSASSGASRVLASHFGIRFDNIPSHLLRDECSVSMPILRDLCERFSLDLVVAGHWHSYHFERIGNTEVIQVGALCPTGFRDLGTNNYGRLIEWPDTRCGSDRGVIGSRQFVLPGLRFLKGEGFCGLREAEDLFKMGAPSGSKLCMDWQVDLKSLDYSRKELDREIATGRVYRGSVNVKPVDLSSRVREAARSVRDRSGIRSAILEYINSLEMPEGVDRRGVLTTTLNYLGAGDES